MEIRLSLQSLPGGATASRTFQWKGLSLIAGRKGELTLDDPRCSKQHLAFSEKNGQLFVEDLNSSNGTLVNGKRVKSKFVKIGDVVRAGRTLIRVESFQSAITSVPAPSAAPVSKVKLDPSIGLGWPAQFQCYPPQQQQRLAKLTGGNQHENTHKD